jgi:hypothetical protein
MKPENLSIWSCFLIIFLLVIASLIYLSGCTINSLASKGLLPDVKERQPPDVQLGKELTLIEEPPKLSTSLIDKDGVAHIFLIDENNQLNHIEIVGDNINFHEIVGEIEVVSWAFFDAIEHPQGKLRVIAGNKQYYRTASIREWQEVKGNRCARFVPAGDDLYCSFVIKGSEVAAPQRTDVHYGWFLLFPFASWSETYASKLVLAQETREGWIVRAVLDPNSPYDADPDFMVETDAQGNFHFLYFTSKGDRSTYFLILPAVVGVIGGFYSGQTTEPILRYAQLAPGQLLAHSRAVQAYAMPQTASPVPWLSLQGITLPNTLPFTIGTTKSASFRLLNRRFSIDKSTREVNGLIWASGVTLVDGDRQLPINFTKDRPDHLWVEIGVNDGRWSPNFRIVAARDIPAAKYYNAWLNYLNTIVKIDSKGNIHALLGSEHPPEWAGKIISYMNYLVKDGDNWSAPLVLGRSTWQKEREEKRTLAVGDSGIAFAAWVNEEDKFVGRWIKPRNGDIQ